MEMAAIDANKATTHEKATAYENEFRRLSFDVQRKGKTIGQHVVDIRRDGEQVVVDTKIDIKINIAFVTVFKYSHTGREIWRDGELVKMDTLSNDNGNEITLTAERLDEGLKVTGTRFDGLMDGPALPTTYWNTATIDCTTLFNTQNGKPMQVSVEKGADEIIQAGGRSIEATRYEIDGDMKTQIWYDRAGTWVKSVFEVRGQEIEYVLVDDAIKYASTDTRVVTR